MIKVLLVDDEIAIRESIRNTFPWEESGYTLVGEAPDGEIALPLIRDANPDILVTDIRMPFMDGIELCREVKRLMPWIGIVILSGYDDFNYAKQAITLGVQEYLLKPVTVKELKTVLDRISAQIQEEKRRRESMESVRRRLASGNRFITNRLLDSLFSSESDEAEAERMIEQMRALGINLAASCYAVLDITFSHPELERGKDALYGLAERSGGAIQLCAVRKGVKALVMGNSENDTEERAYAFAASALHALDDCGAKNVLIAIGEMCERLSDIRRSVKSAQHIRHGVAMRGGGAMRIVGAREMSDKPAALPNLDLQPLYERLQYARIEEFRAVFAEYLASLEATDIHTAVTLDYLRVEALVTAVRIVREAGGEPEAALRLSEYEAGMLPEDGEAAITATAELLQAALRYRDEHNPLHGNSSVVKARYYLAQHFTNPNLMLQDVAGAAGMSNSRFSTVFAQETGFTFTEYLAALRIGKAKELLRATTMRSSQICYAAGYNDPHYFSYMFKKSTGMTPGEYRRSQNENTPE